MNLDSSRSGVHARDSKINQLISIVHSIFAAIDCSLPLDARSAYLGISKAFDRVWHAGLIHKLRLNNVSDGKFLSKSYAVHGIRWRHKISAG